MMSRIGRPRLFIGPPGRGRPGGPYWPPDVRAADVPLRRARGDGRTFTRTPEKTRATGARGRVSRPPRTPRATPVITTPVIILSGESATPLTPRTFFSTCTVRKKKKNKLSAFFTRWDENVHNINNHDFFAQFVLRVFIIIIIYGIRKLREIFHFRFHIYIFKIHINNTYVLFFARVQLNIFSKIVLCP